MFFLGLIAGWILDLINFKLLRRDIEKMPGPAPDGARAGTFSSKRIKRFFFISYLKRYILQGLVLAACLFLKGVSFFLGAVVVLLCLTFLKSRVKLSTLKP